MRDEVPDMPARKRMWRIGPCSYIAEGYCPTCGTRLLADGTGQAMVPAVTSEEVRATKIVRLLECLHEGDLPDSDETRAEFGDIVALAEWGLVSVHGLGDDAPWCEGPDGALLLAALQQPGAWQRAAARLVGEWCAKAAKLHDESIVRVGETELVNNLKALPGQAYQECADALNAALAGEPGPGAAEEEATPDDANLRPVSRGSVRVRCNECKARAAEGPDADADATGQAGPGEPPCE